MVLLLNSEPAESEEKLPPQTTKTSSVVKSIDGVKPVPRLSGENQEHHLGETPASREQITEQKRQPTNSEKVLQPKAPPGKSPSFPFAAVSFAVIAASALASLAIYLQLNAN